MILSLIGSILLGASGLRREPDRSALAQFAREIRALDRPASAQPATAA